MRKKLLKLLILALTLCPLFIGDSESYFTARKTITGNVLSTGCWAAPSVPVLLFPANNTYVRARSEWDVNPYMDWEDSTSSCPLTPNQITYQYESYYDENLTQLAYRSGWLTESRIPAYGTPEGVYYWHVRAKDRLGNVSEFSSAWKLVVDRTAPPTPLLYSPGNNTQFNSSYLDQTWEQVKDNLSSEVYYDYESYNDNRLTLLRWSATFTNSHDGNGWRIIKHAEGAPNGDVYWRVRARDEAGNLSGWSQVWYFRIDNSLSNPTSISPSLPTTSLVVINEILSNPLGNDDALKPGGEWVELYNKGDINFDVNGWKLCDTSTRCINITANHTNRGDAIVPGKGFLVVYLDGQYSNGWLNNTSSDAVYLYDGSQNLIDQVSYSASQVKEGKSIARYPDGSDAWFDPIPTPGEPNILEADGVEPMQNSSIYPVPTPWSVKNPQICLELANDGKSVSFKVMNIKDYVKIAYELTYNCNLGPQGIIAEQELSSQDIFERNSITLGTCSSGGTCVYHNNVSNLQLRVDLTDKNGNLFSLQSNL